MQTTRLQDFADTLSRLYLEQDYEALAKHYDVPGAIYLEDDVIVWTSKETLIRLLRSHCAVNKSLGVHRVTASLAAQGLPERSHLTLWIDWHHEGKDSRNMFPLKVRYFCRASQNGTPVIQLVEIPDQPSCLREMDMSRRLSDTVSNHPKPALA